MFGWKFLFCLVLEFKVVTYTPNWVVTLSYSPQQGLMVTNMICIFNTIKNNVQNLRRTVYSHALIILYQDSQLNMILKLINCWISHAISRNVQIKSHSKIMNKWNFNLFPIFMSFRVNYLKNHSPPPLSLYYWSKWDSFENSSISVVWYHHCPFSAFIDKYNR